jgi:hypothetical protein
MIQRFCYLFVALLCAPLLAQSVEITKGSYIELSWIAPADTDVVQFNAYWIHDSDTVLTRIYPEHWQVTTSPRDLKATIPFIDVVLPLGAGHVRMTAIDRSGNMSRFSESRADYIVVDARPNPPMLVRIKVL